MTDNRYIAPEVPVPRIHRYLDNPNFWFCGLKARARPGQRQVPQSTANMKGYIGTGTTPAEAYDAFATQFNAKQAARQLMRPQDQPASDFKMMRMSWEPRK